MRVIRSGIIMLLVSFLAWPVASQAVDDFDFDALFDFDVEENGVEALPLEEDPAEPAPEPPPEPAPEPAPEPVPEALPEEDDFDWFMEDTRDWEEMEDAEPMPVEEPVDTAPATEPESVDDWLDFDDEPEAIEEPEVIEEPIPAPVEEVPEVEELEDDEAMSEVEREAAELLALEEVRRQAAEVEGLQSLDRGFRLLDREDYTGARDAFTRALERIPDRPSRTDERERAVWGLAESHFRIAQNIYRDDGDIREARRNVDRAQELSPGHRGLSLLQRRVAREEARRADEAARPVPIEQRTEVAERRASVAEMMNEGRAYYEAGEFANAEALFESVLIRDEFNTDAMRYLRRITEERQRAVTELRRTTSAQMMQDVRSAWSPPRRADVTLPEDIMGVRPTDLVTPSQRLQERMEQIVIPRIEFRQASIRDVVSFLRDASEAADPDGDGINIILNLNVPDAPAAAPAPTRAPAAFDDPWGDDDDWDSPAPAFNGGPSGVPTITLNLRRITLMEAIRYITEVAGLRFRIEDNVVVITPADVADTGRVITRLYPVQPSFLDVISERAEEQPPATGFDFGQRRAPTAGRTGDVRAFFEGAGVPFPRGTSISYNSAISQLIVANTPENLETFERILAQLNVVPSQIEIEARFVEVAEEDLQELGLQWIFTDNYEIAQRRSGGPFGGRERVQLDAGNVSRGQRFFAQTTGGIEPVRAATEDAAFLGNILSVSSILTNPEMRVVLHALSQNGNVDVLSAPRVTTRSGQPATIEVVTEIIYPTEFRVTEPVTQSEGGLVTPPVVTPEAFETRRTGVILNVTPLVGPDGYTIDLALAPEVAELVDWIQYGSRISIPGGDPETGRIELREFTFNIPQPVFASRNVQTSIVIWDGQTVVMGGLMRERLVTIKDKVPILGDIPLIGRLFRTEGSRSRKENLLIFVTARLVDPAGKPIHRADAMTGMALQE